MTGLNELFSHIITIFLIWLSLISSIYLIKLRLLKSTKDKEKIIKIARHANMDITYAAILIAITICLFLYNPTERKYEEMHKIQQAPIEESYEEQTKKEVEILNRETIEKQHKEKEEKAEKENEKAMIDAINLFNEIEKGAKQ